MKFLLLLISLFPSALKAQTLFDSELWVSSTTGVGTAAPGARFEARGTAASTGVFRVSGTDLTPAFRVAADGTLGMSATSTARIDVGGTADDGDLALELRGGDLYPNTSSYQATFGYAGGASYRHSIRSQHSNTASSNTLTFSIWNAADSAGTIGSRQALALLSHSTGVAIHVLPPAGAIMSTYTVQLIISDGSSVGAGTMRRKSEGSVSSAAIKEAVHPLIQSDEQAAYIDVKELKHVWFRYKGSKATHRGLLAEESPLSVRGEGGTISIDRRVLNAEMAARELLRMLDEEQAEVQGLNGERP